MADKRLIHHAANTGTIRELLPQLRRADREEILATEDTVLEGVVKTFVYSHDPGAMRDQYGGLVAIYGVAPISLLGRQGAPWLLGTDRMEDASFSVFHDMKLWIEYLREHYDVLFNYVDARNVRSVRWLRSLGFEIGEAVPQGPRGFDFHPFSMDLTDA